MAERFPPAEKGLQSTRCAHGIHRVSGQTKILSILSKDPQHEYLSNLSNPSPKTNQQKDFHQYTHESWVQGHHLLASGIDGVGRRGFITAILDIFKLDP